MTSFIQPTKCYLEYCIVNGVDLVRHVSVARAFETLCKPYITGQLEILDTNNVIENMGIVGGEPVSFAINTTRSRRQFDLNILSLKGQTSTANKRAIQYTIELIGPEYYGDRSNLVQQAFKGITATDAVAKIYSQYLGSGIDIMVPSAGLLGKDNSYIVNSTKPFKAISDLKKLMSFTTFQTGNVLNWADRDGHHIAPLEYLFSTISAQQTFIQKGTWGSSWQDLARVENAIIAASAIVNPEEAGRVGLQMISSTSTAERKVIDFLSNKGVFDTMASSVAAGAAVGKGISAFLSAIIGSGPGGHGGEHNYYLNDSSRIPNENVRQTDKEKAYGAQVAGGPQYTIQVPIQTGLQCVVGKGINAQLLPPVGDQTSPFIPTSQTGGLMLVVDAMHECHLDDTSMAGTSIFRCARGGIG